MNLVSIEAPIFVRIDTLSVTLLVRLVRMLGRPGSEAWVIRGGPHPVFGEVPALSPTGFSNIRAFVNAGTGEPQHYLGREEDEDEEWARRRFRAQRQWCTSRR